MKITCSKQAILVLLLTILCAYSPSLFAQQGNDEDTASSRCHHLVIIDHDPTGLTAQFDEDYIPTLDEDCEYTKSIAINIMGENVFGNQFNGDETSNIPGHPPLFVELRYGNADPLYIEAGYFFWSETANCVGEVYTAFVPLTFNFSSVCNKNELPPDRTGVGVPSRFTCSSGPLATIDYTVKLVTPHETEGYVDYPVGQFTGEGEIFDCQAFDETGHCCQSNNDCLSFALNSTHTVKACCGDCDGEITQTPGPSYPKDDPVAFRKRPAIGSLVAPNPFHATLDIQFTDGSDDPVNIDILDLNGKVIQSTSPRPMRKGEQVRMGAENLSPGIYYIRIHSVQGVETHKVIKI
ncbi:MAG: T9SS type A sorting domain-containing protein [Bacteroidota bacterium]